jgi:hypothetical protein
MSELATTRASPDLAAKAERRRQKFALKEWEGSATRAAHDARVRSAKSQYADIFHSNGNTPGARRGASPAGAPATPAGGSYAATEMARRARRTPPSRARLARTPETPESARVASRANGAHASGGRNLDAALAASPPRETPGSRIRAAAAVALTPDSKYRARVLGESAGTPAEASPGARRGTDREGGDDGDDGGSPLGPESSLGGSRLARRGSSRSPASRLPSPPAARRALGDVSHAPERVVAAPELATPETAKYSYGDAAAPGSSARPSTGRNLARFLKRRQALRLAEAERAAEAGDGPSGVSGETSASSKILKAANAREEANKENVDPAWAEYEADLATSPRSARDAEARASAPRAPLAPLAAETLAFRPEEKEKEKEESLGAFIERATAEAEAEAASAALAFSGYSERNDVSETSPDAPFFVRDDDDDAYPPTPAESPSPLRSANAETHAAWIKQGYGAIRASAAAAAPRYAEDDEPESETGRGDDDDAWNEYAGDAAGGVGGFDEARVEPFKMTSPGTLRRAAAETARSASLARYA